MDYSKLTKQELIEKLQEQDGNESNKQLKINYNTLLNGVREKDEEIKKLKIRLEEKDKQLKDLEQQANYIIGEEKSKSQFILKQVEDNKKTIVDNFTIQTMLMDLSKRKEKVLEEMLSIYKNTIIEEE